MYIGSPGHPLDANDANPVVGAGSVFLLHRASTTVYGKVTAPFRRPNARFGQSVAANDTILAVGSPHQSAAQVIVFEKDGPGLQYNYLHQFSRYLDHEQRSTTDDGFGHALALDDSVLIAGIPLYDDQIVNEGAVVFFDLSALSPVGAQQPGNFFTGHGSSSTEEYAAIDLNVTEAANHDAIVLWPNPARQRIFFKGSERIDSFNLFTLEDKKLISTKQFPQKGMEIGHLAPEIYLVMATSDEGVSIVQRLVKE